MPLRPCLDCGALSTASRCPLHTAQRHRDRDAQRGGTAARSYGAEHQKRRAELLPSAFGTPCPRCHNLMLEGQSLDLDHSNPTAKAQGLPGDRMTHSACNQGQRTPQ